MATATVVRAEFEERGPAHPGGVPVGNPAVFRPPFAFGVHVDRWGRLKLTERFDEFDRFALLCGRGVFRLCILLCVFVGGLCALCRSDSNALDFIFVFCSISGD